MIEEFVKKGKIKMIIFRELNELKIIAMNLWVRNIKEIDNATKLRVFNLHGTKGLKMVEYYLEMLWNDKELQSLHNELVNIFNNINKIEEGKNKFMNIENLER